MEKLHQTQSANDVKKVLHCYLQGKKDTRILTMSQAIRDLRDKVNISSVPDSVLAEVVAQYALADGFGVEFNLNDNDRRDRLPSS